MNGFQRDRDNSPAVAATGRTSDWRGVDWTIEPAGGIRGPASRARFGLESARDETVFAEVFHLVERPDVRHAIVDLALRRTGRQGRAGQPLLPHPWRQDRSDAWVRAALGGL